MLTVFGYNKGLLIDKRKHLSNETAFQYGCIFFLEPGYYEEGYFGIRLETIVEVVTKNTPVRAQNCIFLTDFKKIISFTPFGFRHSLIFL